MTSCEPSGKGGAYGEIETIKLAITFAVPSCFWQPKIKAGTVPEFKSSYSEVEGRLPARRARLDDALKTITEIQLGAYPPLLDAEHYEPATAADLSDLGKALGNVFSQVAAKAVDVGLDAARAANRATFGREVQQAGGNGRTADEIIQAADDERRQAIKRAIEIYQKQLAQTLDLVALEDASKARIPHEDEHHEVLSDRKAALQEAVTDIQKRIDALQKQLGSST